MKLRRRIRQVGEVVAAYLAYACLVWLPRPVIVAVSRGLGRLAFRFPSRERRVALANLDAAYGDSLSDEEKHRIARRSFQTFALTILDVFWFSVRTEARLSRYLRDEGAVAALQSGSPCISVTAHFGSWETAAHSLALAGLRPTSVAMPMKNRVVDHLLIASRQRLGQEIVSREGALKSLTRVLRRGGLIGLVLDQNSLPQEGGVFVTFFGLPVPVAKTAELLSGRYNAAVVLVYCMADDRGAYTLWCEDTLDAEHPLVKASGVTQAVTTVTERVIRRHPGQWLWMYKRWKYIPEGAPADRYPYYARAYQKT